MVSGDQDVIILIIIVISGIGTDLPDRYRQRGWGGEGRLNGKLHPTNQSEKVSLVIKGSDPGIYLRRFGN